MRFPLSLKILCWLLLNFLLLGVAFLFISHFQFRFGLNALISGSAGARIDGMTDLIGAELRHSPRKNWDEILARFGAAYRLNFSLFGNDGKQIAGADVTLPEEVHTKLMELRPPQPQKPPPVADPPPPRDNPPPIRTGGGPPNQNRPASGQQRPPPDDRPSRDDFDNPNGLPSGHPPPPPKNTMKFLMRSAGRYWLLAHVPLNTSPHPQPLPSTLVSVSDSLSAGGLFFDFRPLLAAGAGALIFSVLLWLPLMRGITRSLKQTTRATEQIAEGRFDVRVSENRRDELGSLGQAVNRMAARLAGFVTGQKRFLGDIAHELCSPIARMQMALGILEERASENQSGYVADVREELQHISSLVNELLSFSKASLGGKNVALKPVALAEIAARAVSRESRDKGGVVVDVPPALSVLADPELLARAIGNVVRNAIRYANPVNAESGAQNYTYRPKNLSDGRAAGPVVVSAHRDGAHVLISIADNGPGIPEAALAQIFDPFFRVDTARARETGGTGLGLAIVKTCVESCGGTVTARNRQPSGLEIEIKLKAA